MSAIIHRTTEYVNLVIAFQAALIWTHQGHPGGSVAGDELVNDIETCFYDLRESLRSKNAWFDAEELRAKALQEAIKNRDDSI